MNVLVTGCSRGVGLEICRVLLEQGNTVYGVARSYTDEFKALEAEYAGKLFFKSIDLSDSESIRKSVFKEFVGNKVVLDVYVNNAAMAYDDIVTNLNLDRLKAMYAVNVFTPMMMTKYAIRNMLLHHTRGSIKGSLCMLLQRVHSKHFQRIRLVNGGGWAFAPMW